MASLTKLSTILTISTLLLLAGCSGLGALANRAGPGATIATSLGQPTKSAAIEERSSALGWSDGSYAARSAIVEPGQPGAVAAVSAGGAPVLDGRPVELNFVETDVREFARVLFSEVLRVPYLIDPNVSGTVTVRSGGKIPAQQALALARTALETQGSTIRVTEGVYRVTANSGGFDTANVKTFELKHIDPDAAQGALQGLVQGRAEIISSSGSAITLRGDPETLSLVGSMIAAIDVDRFRSSSFGLFPLRYGAAAEVADELGKLYGGVGVSNQTILGIERINAVLVVASKSEHLEFAGTWIERLDQGPQNQRLVQIYTVKNRDPDTLAKLLQDMFAGTMPVETELASAADGESLTAPGSFLSGPVKGSDGIKVTADPGANKLVIRATRSEYALIEQALRRLDTPLAQVYVEATIAEVRLGGELSKGVRWFLQAGGISGGFSDASNGAVAPAFPGFNFAIQVPQVDLVISALESHTDVRIVSTPQLTVVDRETATIQVGDQVPIITKSVQDASGGGTVIANDVTFRDTGVILKVTPQIRSSNEVLLAIAQEVSRVVPTTSSQIDSPTISQRKVESTVLVPDGTAIVLAGLMSNSEEGSQGGLPGTKATLLENIFGSKKETAARSELIVIIRPVIIRDRTDLRDIAAEVAQKMQDVMQVQVD